MTLTLLKDFTIAADLNQTWNTDWIQFPAEHVNAQLVVVVKSRVGTVGALLQLQSTWDTDSVVSAGGSVTTAGAGTSIVDITSNLGPMVRLSITALNAATLVTLSVYLTPKSA